MTLRDQVVLVTGASRGIGAAAAATLARAGATVVLAARSQALLEARAAALIAAGGRAGAVALDVTSDASVAAAVAEIERRWVRSTCSSTTPARAGRSASARRGRPRAEVARGRGGIGRGQAAASSSCGCAGRSHLIHLRSSTTAE